MSDLAWLLIAVVAFVAGVFVGRGLGGISFTLSSRIPVEQRVVSTTVGPGTAPELPGSSVGSSRLLRTIAVGRTIIADDLDIDVTSLELREAGAILAVAVRDREPGGGAAIPGVPGLSIPEAPIVHVSDDVGTVYTVTSALTGGKDGALVGDISLTPAIPAAAKRVSMAVVATTDDPRPSWAAHAAGEPGRDAPRLDIPLED